MDEERRVDGYLFSDIENGNIAREELKRIEYISSKMNEDNPAAILSVYNKMIESKTFLTPVGLSYLRSIQEYLLRKPEIDDSKVADIPVEVSYVSLREQADNEKNEQRKKNRRVKTFKKEYKTSLIVNLVLIVMVIAMFIIVLTSDTPNMINYKNALENQYADWEQQLTERENAVREKENELLDKQ